MNCVDALAHRVAGLATLTAATCVVFVAVTGAVGCGQRTAPCDPQAPITADCQGRFCWMPAGCGYAGPAPDDPCLNAWEGRQRVVQISWGLSINAFEVTRREYEDVMGAYEGDGCLDCPAEVSHDAAEAYCAKLSQREGLEVCYQCDVDSNGATSCSPSVGRGLLACTGYRLPTDAEWERAARGGTSTPLYSGRDPKCADRSSVADAIAWYWGVEAAQPVGLKVPNAYGLYDTAGNAREWTADGISEEFEVYPLAVYTALEDTGRRLWWEDATDPFEPERDTWTGRQHRARGGGFKTGAMFLRPAFLGPYLLKQLAGFRCVRR